jgi:hypothetical protein
MGKCGARENVGKGKMWGMGNCRAWENVGQGKILQELLAPIFKCLPPTVLCSLMDFVFLVSANKLWITSLFIYLFILLTPMCIGYIHHFLYLVFIILIS